MNYIVFDLEWNQCPTGKAKELPELPFEIVEIGAVKLNAERKPIGEFHQYISPQIYQELHYITAGILNISMKELKKNGQPFETVIREFCDWCGAEGEYVFCTWGSMDLTELQRNCKFFQCEFEFKHPLLFNDLQKMFSICYDDGKSRKSLEDAIDEMKLNRNLTFHSAMNDAVYTARIMSEMDYEKVKKYTSVDTYWVPANREEEFTLYYPTYSKFVSHIYSNREAMLTDGYLLSSICPICKKHARKKIRWFAANTKSYYCVALCSEHGTIKGRMKIRKTDQENFYIVKIMKPTDEEGVTKIREKQSACREKRRERRHREHEKNQK